MPDEISAPSVIDLGKDGLTGQMVDFINALPDNIRGLSESQSFNNLVYFLWALFFAIFAYTLYIVFLTIQQEKRQREDYFNYFAQVAYAREKTSKRGSDRWNELVEHLKSENEADWKIAILEADSLLSELIEGLGYEGQNLGERLKNVHKDDMRSLDDAWVAHKIRNRIAHEGMSIKLTRADLADTIAHFERVFREFDYI
ncbi:MAG TPA: hypothetical protein VJJ22_03785 [Candidatus Paceibacterota bacterium]